MSYTRIPTVKEACELEADALDFALSDQVEHLTDLIAETEGKADAFFDRNHVTHGMERLLREGLQRLNGKTGQAVFQLTQAMGGGKTHSMLALGLLARNPHLYSRVPASITEGLEGSKARVVAINGRQISNDIFLWGEIAEQLGKKEQFSKFWKSVPDAPREQDWIDVIGDEPTLILLDELPPYFDYAKTRAVGSGTLANVTTYALSNLLSAAMKLPRTAIVVSNLTGSYQGATQDLAKAIKDIAEETKRQARSITPVDLSGNEIYDILRKRMFKKLPSKAEIEKVADAYGEAINLAERSKTIPKSPEQIADEVIGSYPFHPSVKNIIALFRNNENYRQTRGLMQFVSKMLKSVWEGEQSGNVYLVGCQHLDLTIPDVREEVNRIGDLQGAMARDVVATDGSAHAQIIDANRGTDSATQAAKLLLSASLSDSVDAVKGLTKATLVEYLIAPERSASEFDEAFESLTKEAWYLHRGETNKDVWYFSNVENLRKRIQNRAQSAPIGKIEEEMRRRLKNAFEPSSKKAYSTVYALPRIDEIETNQQNRFCLVLSPDSKTPPDEAQKFLESVTTKNSFCVVTGESSNLGNLEDKVRAIWAIAKVRTELGERSPHLPEIQELEENSEFDFNSALTTLFNRVYFPMPTPDRKGTRLTHTAIKLSVEKGSSGKSAPNVAGEAAVEAALAAIGAKKLIIDYDQSLDSLIERAEEMLWPEKTTRIPWADVVLRSKSNARWPWLPPKGLETVRDHAVSIGRWTHDGDGYVDKAPPKPVTSASISERSYDPETGTSEIEIFPLNAGPAPKIWVSKTGDFNTSSEQLDGSLLTTTDTKLWFLVKDPTDAHEQGDSVVWVNKLTLTHQPRFALGKRTVELNVVPRGEIRWNITGANEKEGAVYSGPIELEGSDKVTIYAYASDKGVGVSKEFVIPATESDQQIDPKRKATYKKQMERTGVADAFNLLKAAEDNKARLAEVTIAIGDGTQTMRTRFGSDTVLTPDYVREVIALGRKGLGSENAVVKITVKNTAFDSGYDLEQFFKALGEDVQAKDVEQA